MRSPARLIRDWRPIGLAVLFTLCFGSASASAATLNVFGGQLMGASNVLVDGSYYDVQFLDGTCIDLFNGCDEVSDFTFQTQASALLASQALLDQVFLDGVDGLFDSVLELTNGCENAPDLLVSCYSFTPYYSGPDFGNPFVLFLSESVNTVFESDAPYPAVGDRITSGLIESVDIHSSVYSAATWAVWSPTVVPEPSTALLLGLGLTGLAAKGRRRNRA